MRWATVVCSDDHLPTDTGDCVSIPGWVASSSDSSTTENEGIGKTRDGCSKERQHWCWGTQCWTGRLLDLDHETEVYAKLRECPRVGHLHVRRLRVSRKDGDGVFIQRYNPSEDAGSLHPAR